MTNIKNYNIHIAFLVFEMVLGSIIIQFPLDKNGTETMFATLLAGALAVPFSVLLCKKSTQNAPNNISNLYGAFALIICLYFVFYCAKTYTGFCDDLMLPFTPNTVLSTLLLISAFAVGSFRREALLKLCLLFGILCLLFYLILFVGLLSGAEISLDFQNFTLKSTGAQTVKIFARSFGTLCLLPIIIKGQKFDKKSINAGLYVGAAVIFAAVSLVRFTLMGVSAGLSVPFYAACGTVKIGEDLARVDFLCLFNLFVTAFIKLCALFFAAKEIIYQIFKKKSRAVYTAFCALAILLCVQHQSLLFFDSFYVAAGLATAEFLLVCFYP